MFKRFFLAGLMLALGSSALAATPMHPMHKPAKKPAHAPMHAAAKLSPKPIGAEVAFVTAVQADLMKRFATAKDAEAAGYVRFGNEDKSGSISYANQQWNSADAQHPSQLWYDVNGNLLGADFSVVKTPDAAPGPPKLWGVNPARWLDFKKPHVHWILKDPKTGMLSYGATSGKKFVAAGGVLASPTAATVVKLGKAKDAADVVSVFVFPALWDLQVWVKPNPNGAFAEMNPNVKPTKDAGKEDM